MDSNCLFCKIVNGTVAVKRVYEDESCIAFPDIRPQAPVHHLVIPKEHVGSHAEAVDKHVALVGKVMAAAGILARQEALRNGYRLVINTGEDGGQTVNHFHVHLLGGRPMSWPPG